MNGANEYARLFDTGQHGRLYFVSGHHARGLTFKIYVLPKDEKAIPNGEQNAPLNDNAVCVYGELGGQPGWTEYYGWIEKGPWQEDFYKIVEVRKAEIAESKKQDEQSRKELDEKRNKEKLELLSTYGAN